MARVAQKTVWLANNFREFDTELGALMCDLMSAFYPPGVHAEYRSGRELPSREKAVAALAEYTRRNPVANEDCYEHTELRWSAALGGCQSAIRSTMAVLKDGV